MQETKKNELRFSQVISWGALLAASALACEPAQEWVAVGKGKDPGPELGADIKKSSKQESHSGKQNGGQLDSTSKVGVSNEQITQGGSAADLVYQEAQGLGLNSLKNGEWSYKDPTKPWRAIIEADGRVRFESARAQAPINDALRFSGPEDWIRRGGSDSKSAKDRLQWLKSTHDFRVRLREKWVDSLWKIESKKLEENLLKIWKNSAVGPIERRKRIFELWDEYAELKPVKEDSTEFVDRIELFGDRSRTKIYGFIGKHLAKGSANAYSENELSQLNRSRKSRAEFTPYLNR